MKFLLVFLFFVLIKVLLNMYRYARTRSLYKKFLSGKNFTSFIPELDILFKNAGTSYKTTYDELKHGYWERSVRDIAYSADKSKYFNEVNKVFQITIGVYRLRIKNALNLFYWLFLPLNLLYSKSICPNSAVKTIITVMYWALGTVASYLLNLLLDFVYRDYLLKLLKTLL